MPRLDSIGEAEHEFYKFPTIKWFSEASNQRGLARGGIYLLSGPPGCGKTTVALEMMIDLASVGIQVLYLTLEQSPGWLKNTIRNRIYPYRQSLITKKGIAKSTDWKKQLKRAASNVENVQSEISEEEIAEKNFYIDLSIPNMESLPDFFTRQVLTSSGQYKGTKILVVDSLQGLGTAPTSSKPYSRLYEFNKYVKEEGITCLLIGHVTKSGKIAGPRSLEHNVDCVLYMRSAMKLRPFFVPKNRFGPERYEPFALIANKWGCLEKSKHMEARSSIALSYLARYNIIAEAQALVKLPKLGSRPGLIAPYLPQQKIKHLIGIISNIKDVDISDLAFEVNCYLPSGVPYFHTLDFAISMSILASYFQLPLPPDAIFMGEVDLSQRIRPLPHDEVIIDLCYYLASENNNRHIDRIYICEEQVELLTDNISERGLNIEVIGVNMLEDVLTKIWPEIKV